MSDRLEDASLTISSRLLVGFSFRAKDVHRRQPAIEGTPIEMEGLPSRLMAIATPSS